MIIKNDFIKISPYQWELPPSFRKEMRVPVSVFASEALLENALTDTSIEQAINATTLPGVLGKVMVMPDVHQGYGFPIGGVAATSIEDGVITPGGIGYDINCGVRLLASQIPLEAVSEHIHELTQSLNLFCPSGVGVSGGIKLSNHELIQVCNRGADWAKERGYASTDQIRRTEDQGYLKGADASRLSPRALERGKTQLGTLGSGNHFIEVGVVSQIFNESIARTFGLIKGMLTVMIHCGSRGLGHQVCSDYVRIFQQASHKYKIESPDRELISAPLRSPEGQDYLAAMRAAANFAFCNRQVLAYQAQLAFEKVFAGMIKNWHLIQVYDVAHNIGKIEKHWVDGQKREVCLHRKGATRAFGPHEESLPGEFMKTGQPVLVPGSMGTSSWVLAGTSKSMEESFGSCCHGAGRVMSRSQAKRSIDGSQLIKALADKGIRIQAGSINALAEEAPQAYKDVDEVIEVVTKVGLASKVARLTPLAVIKG